MNADMVLVVGIYLFGFICGACLTALMRGNDDRP